MKGPEYYNSAQPNDETFSPNEKRERYPLVILGSHRRCHLRLWVFLTSLAVMCLILAWQGIFPLRWRLHFNCKTAPTADDILSKVPLIDGHNDFPLFIRTFYGNDIYQPNFSNAIQLPGQVDFRRLKEGRLKGQFWSVYVPCPNNSENFSDDTYREIVHDTFQQIDLVNRLVKEFPQDLTMASSADDVWSNFKKSDTISSLMGIEGLHQIGNSASVLRIYHKLGVRYATLAHFCHNKYADSATPKAIHNGLSPEGEAIVREMNRLGMIIDLSHVSPKTMLDTLQISSAPVMFSHSSAFALCPHPRNVPDDVLIELRKNGGVVMITFVPEYICCNNKENATLSDVADHIQHVGNLIGYEHVGLGSDFDGMDTVVKELEDVSKYPALIEELLRRGVSATDLYGLVGGNVLRVLKAVELEAERQHDTKPLQDKVKSWFA